ncbi:ATP adenylyltransferase [Caballeronia turbans]|uniref:ATP adenylyltransferase family protein n=1 Tax=unclassified Caballeronia TaxID=2646786 RepID=UPI00074CA6AB|nr:MULTISPECIES: phosphorylase [unclassified Caballeronia]SAL30812.1 ATP adenylyltransferase [Caballeronia turbans]
MARMNAPSWQDVVTQTERALACGALRSFDTVQSVIEDGGVPFLVRQAANLARKEEASKLAAKSAADAASAWRDPFSPCEEALRVGDIGERHFLLLNKFNVLAHHLLIVTKDFEPQDSLVGEDDFAALFSCLDRFDGLGFYNGGTVAGSSQPHKHLQIVPLPLDGHALPVEPFIEAAHTRGVFRAPQLAFAHAAAWLDDDAAANLHATYLQLMNAIGVQPFDVAGVAHQSAPYNLLVTRRWMLAVPRSVSHVEGVAVNALGFAGSLFVRDDAQRNVVETLGPMKLLADATIS